VPATVELRDVTPENWRSCVDLEVAPDQRDFVSPVARYLCLCHYGGVWQPLAAYLGREVVGFAMWGVDPEDGSLWIGGLTIDRRFQRRGYGRALVVALCDRLRAVHGCTSVSLSTVAENTAARRLYESLGFDETGELEGDELVYRIGFDEA
jgi:diamine N-acetyltransferase